MDALRKAITNLFPGEQPAREGFELGNLDRNNAPALQTRPAGTGTTIMPKPVATAPARQDAARAATTRPGYRAAPQAPTRERAGSADAVTPKSGSQVGQPSALASSSQADAGVFLDALKHGKLAIVQNYIKKGIDLSSLMPRPGPSPMAMAFKNKNLPLITILLPHSSHADKLEALASVVGLRPANRNPFEPCIKAILDSANRANKSGPNWEKNHDEIAFMSKLLDR